MTNDMGELLLYSWLRHEKECQLVQTNWKPSPLWRLGNEDELKRLLKTAAERFESEYGYDIQGKSTFRMFLSQGEIDVLGISVSGDHNKIYAVESAFHIAGLNYGKGSPADVIAVIKKSLRCAMCIKGYFDTFDGEIIFATPKAGQTVHAGLNPCIADLNALFAESKYSFKARLITNDDYNEQVLQPTLLASKRV